MKKMLLEPVPVTVPEPVWGTVPEPVWGIKRDKKEKKL